MENTNNKTMSTTQTSNYVAIAGLIVYFVGKLGLDLEAEDVVTAIGCLVTLGAIIKNYLHRFGKGDVTLSGKYK